MGIAPEVGYHLRLLVVALLCVVAARASNYYVVIAGLGGTPEYETQFQKWTADLERELRANGADAQVTALSGSTASKQAIESLFMQLRSVVKPDDAFSLLLIGHGSFDGTDYKFNIPGPDLTAAELANLMNGLSATRQLVMNMTSCSGASEAALRKKGRLVVTATKSGTERNATVFPRYFVDSLRDPAADSDKNGTITLLEAFRYTQRKLTSHYDSEKILATEHPLLNGAADSPDERLAAVFPLLRTETENARASNPAKQSLLQRKQDLETRIDRLKYEKPAMAEEEYKRQLTSLLLELARTQAEIDR
jgi:hypothetical protein